MNNEKYFADFLLRELFEAYHKARTGGKRKTEDEHRFEMNELENLVTLRDSIMARRYKPSRGVAFIIHDPVVREIFAAPFVDRVVHHFLYKYAVMWWERRFLPCSYSCREGKGTLYGIKDLQRKIRRVTMDGTVPAMVVKRDLRGYFMSLEHKRLFERVVWGLDRQFPNGGELYRVLKYLWHEVIFDNPTKGVRIRGKISDWNELPPDKSLFCQPEGRGIVIGNVTSQELSNIYLDQLDRFVVIDKGYRNYGRYVDDFYIVVPVGEFGHLKEDLIDIEQYIDRLGLTLHPKKKYNIPARNGTEFLGAKVFAKYILPGDRIAKNFAEAVYKLETTGVGKIEGIGSYDGHLAHFNSNKLINKIFGDVGWEYVYGGKSS